MDASREHVRRTRLASTFIPTFAHRKTLPDRHGIRDSVTGTASAEGVAASGQIVLARESFKRRSPRPNSLSASRVVQVPGFGLAPVLIRRTNNRRLVSIRSCIAVLSRNHAGGKAVNHG